MRKHIGNWWGMYVLVAMMSLMLLGIITAGKHKRFSNACEVRCELKQLYFLSSNADTQECWCRPARIKEVRIKAE